MAVRTGDSLLAGRYRVLRPLGAGGMASVALCKDERLGRRVAVKRLHAHGNEDDQRRFLREAKVGASLNHPNLVSVYDIAMDDESVLIVMEYVEGETLADAIADGPLPADRAASVIRDAASALEHAHSHGIVHRDVKPANILLRKDGVAKLVDLGIAVAADTTRITQSGTVLGTASYMAPEQFDGRPAGPPADVYALAAVAFEALSARKARQGRSAAEVAHRVTTEPPPDLTEAWPDAPPGAAQALREGMARDPEERPSPTRLAEELGRALARERTALTRDLPPSSPPPPPRSATPRPAPPPKRSPVPHTTHTSGSRRGLAALLAVGLAALAVAAIALLGGGDGSSEERRADRGTAERPSGAAERDAAGRESAPSQSQGQAQQPQDEQPPAAGAPSGSAAPSGSGAAEGARLNAQGYALMRQGRYEQAVPVLQRAVDAFPQGTSDLRYAYALFNLGSSLRQAGRPAEAIPILERRLRIPNQTETVRRELALARRQADG